MNSSTSYKGETEVSRLTEQDNRLFLWFAHEYLQRELEPSDDADPLRPARKTLLGIYEYAERDVPAYFPGGRPSRNMIGAVIGGTTSRNAKKLS